MEPSDSFIVHARVCGGGLITEQGQKFIWDHLLSKACSLNMLEGDTGCSIWPSSLFLSELILCYPESFSNKSCFEIGSGIGLVGICLAHVKASKVKCMYLPWESASESQLQDVMPDIVLGADVIYDPFCLPHLVRVISILLSHEKSYPCRQVASCEGVSPNNKYENGGVESAVEGTVISNYGSSGGGRKEAPLAYIACVVRKVETFKQFLSLADEAKLAIVDLTESLKPVNLLPYMHSYNQATITLLRITYNP